MLHITVKNHMIQLQITVTNNIVEGSRTIILCTISLAYTR